MKRPRPKGKYFLRARFCVFTVQTFRRISVRLESIGSPAGAEANAHFLRNVRPFERIWIMHVFRLRVRRASHIQTDSIFDCAQLRIQRRGKSERALFRRAYLQDRQRLPDHRGFGRQSGFLMGKGMPLMVFEPRAAFFYFSFPRYASWTRGSFRSCSPAPSILISPVSIT